MGLVDTILTGILIFLGYQAVGTGGVIALLTLPAYIGLWVVFVIVAILRFTVGRVPFIGYPTRVGFYFLLLILIWWSILFIPIIGFIVLLLSPFSLIILGLMLILSLLLAYLRRWKAI